MTLSTELPLLYARSRRLDALAALYAVAAISSAAWLPLTRKSPLDEMVDVRLGAFTAFVLAISAAGTMTLSLGEFEGHPKTARQLRAVHLAFAACPALVVAVSPQYRQVASVFAGVLALALLTTLVYPSFPFWLPPSLCLGLEYVVGVNRGAHDFYSWAHWMNPTPLGDAVSWVSGLVTVGIWLLRGPRWARDD